jgi:RNA polymerase sigma-70 factor (ECF subfamily)
MQWTDEEAANRARQGDQAAFRLLVERHSHAIFRLAFRISGNEYDAEDLVQETFLRAYKQLVAFDGRAAVGTWLYRICVNCSLDLIRVRKQRRSDDTTRWLDRMATSDPGPERLLQSHQIAALLEPALDLLSETERTAFILRHHEGLGIEEIAELLGVERGAAKHSVFRAVQKLRRALQPVWELEVR